MITVMAKQRIRIIVAEMEGIIQEDITAGDIVNNSIMAFRQRPGWRAAAILKFGEIRNAE